MVPPPCKRPRWQDYRDRGRRKNNQSEDRRLLKARCQARQAFAAALTAQLADFEQREAVSA